MIQQAAEAERVETPLQRRLEQFGYTLLWLALGVVARRLRFRLLA